MITTRFALALAAGLAVPCVAAAHGEFENAAWCADGVPVYTGTFAFTRNDLVAEFNRRQQAVVAPCTADMLRPTPGNSGGVGTCGVFDPPYEVARSMARAACGAQDSATTQDATVVAFIAEPQTFNDPDHHATFDFDSGLNGMCGVCIPAVSTPPPIHPAIRPPIGQN